MVLWRQVGDRVKLAAETVATPADPTPQDAIYGMLEAARAGDVKKYLSYYAGPIAAALRQTAAEQGYAGFARYLKERNAPIKGLALNEPQPVSNREVKIRAEYVYQDRNEAQIIYLQKEGRDWKIARLDTAERVKTLVPYGSPVQ